LGFIGSPIFAIEEIQDPICKNQGLKELDLRLTIQDTGIAFEENEEFSLLK